jgi:hypothetical protein
VWCRSGSPGVRLRGLRRPWSECRRWAGRDGAGWRSRRGTVQGVTISAGVDGWSECRRTPDGAGRSAPRCADLAVVEVPGLTEVDVDVPAGRVTVHGESVDDDAVRAAITEAGYEVTAAVQGAASGAVRPADRLGRRVPPGGPGSAVRVPRPGHRSRPALEYSPHRPRHRGDCDAHRVRSDRPRRARAHIPAAGGLTAHLRVLFISQILSGAGLAAGITVGGLIVEQMLGSTGFAGLPPNS